MTALGWIAIILILIPLVIFSVLVWKIRPQTTVSDNQYTELRLGLDNARLRILELEEKLADAEVNAAISRLENPQDRV